MSMKYRNWKIIGKMFLDFEKHPQKQDWSMRSYRKSIRASRMKAKAKQKRLRNFRSVPSRYLYR